MDWDFEAALASPQSAMPGPKYEELRLALQPQLEEALAAGDRATYASIQGRLYDAYIDACPAAVPPRTADPAYRARFVAYTVSSIVEQDFDDDCRFLMHEMEKAIKRLTWQFADGQKPRVASSSFWELVRAVKAKLDRGLYINVKSGLVKTHPDGAPPALLARMGISAFVQGWLPYLSPVDADRLIDEARLHGEYRQVTETSGEDRPCPACDEPIHVVEGAVRVQCESCGQRIEVGALQITCTQCGGPMAIPGGSDRAPCPFCGCDVRALRIPGVRSE